MDTYLETIEIEIKLWKTQKQYNWELSRLNTGAKPVWEKS